MVRIWEYVIICFFFCKYNNFIECSPISNNTVSSSESRKIAPQFRSKSIEASKETLIVKVGNLIRIYCGVTGTPEQSVYFYKDNKLLERSTNFEWSRYTIDHYTLRISSAKISDTGTYRCVAVNGQLNSTLHFRVRVNQEESQSASTLHPSNVGGNPPSVEFKPRFTKPERMQKQLHAEPAGNTVRFQCRVEGNPVPTVRWYKDGKEIVKHGRVSGYKIKNGGQILSLETVIPNDDGIYECVAKNKLGNISHSYELDVQERQAVKPIIATGYLRNQTVYLGGHAEFKCLVYSDAHPHIEWVRTVVVNKTEPKIMKLKTSGVNTTDQEIQKLVITNVSVEDAGEYTCIAGNSIGISHESVWLKVLPEPDISTRMPPGPEVVNVIYGLVAVLATILVIGVVLFFYINQRNGKDPPMLVPIKNPDNIPQMTKVEIPTMYRNCEAWRTMCLPGHEQFELNIPPDLQWELRREDIILTERLDEGFFGQVFKADLLSPNARNEVIICAVKMLKASRTEKDVLDLLSEMDQMKRIGKHRNIINLLGVCTQNGPLMLVTDYASEGNLREFLRRNRPQNMHCNFAMPPDMHASQLGEDSLLSQRDLVSCAHQVSRGMDYLAQKKCVHRDLAARNVLVTEDRVMKIADFGLARDIRSCDYYRKHTRGHLPYKWMALEAMADNVFTHATDVWSFGVLLWEIFSLSGTPYPGIKTGELVKFLRSGERLEKPQFATQEMYMLMRDCWEEDPRRRPIFRSLVEDLEKMMSEASSDELITEYDVTAEYDDSAESEDTDEDDDDVFVQTENSDSISEGNVPFHEERDSFNSDSYAAPLLGSTTNHHSNIMHNQHARLRSDV